MRVVQQAHGLARQNGTGVFGGPVAVQWRQLGAAAQARPEPRLLGLRRMVEKTAVFTPRRAHAAHRAAVNAGGCDADEKAAVKARIVRAQRAVAGIVVEGGGADHGADGMSVRPP